MHSSLTKIANLNTYKEAQSFVMSLKSLIKFFEML